MCRIYGFMYVNVLESKFLFLKIYNMNKERKVFFIFKISNIKSVSLYINFYTRAQHNCTIF